MMSNRPGSNESACKALSGPDHQVTRAETAPPKAAAPRSSQPTLTASHRLRVTLCRPGELVGASFEFGCQQRGTEQHAKDGRHAQGHDHYETAPGAVTRQSRRSR